MPWTEKMDRELAEQPPSSGRSAQRRDPPTSGDAGMTNDILARLKNPRHPNIPDMQDGADEITRLRAELAAERSKRELYETVAAREQREKANALTDLAAEREQWESERKICDQSSRRLDERLRGLEAERDALRAELAAVKKDADAVCDSYATENQQFHDRFTAAEAERDALRELLRDARQLISANYLGIYDRIDAALNKKGE